MPDRRPYVVPTLHEGNIRLLLSDPDSYAFDADHRLDLEPRAAAQMAIEILRVYAAKNGNPVLYLGDGTDRVSTHFPLKGLTADVGGILRLHVSGREVHRQIESRTKLGIRRALGISF